MAAKGGGESRAGLVVFLVLFILLSISLGVTTYLGYSEIDKEKQATKTATDEKAAWEKDANWYKFVANTYRMYMGLAQTGDDVAAMRTQYNDGAGPLFTASRDKFREEHRKAITDQLDKTKKWDVVLKKPTETLKDEIDNLKKDLADKEKAAKDTQEQLAQMTREAEARKRELDAAKIDFAQKLAKRKDDDELELKGLRTTVTELQDTISKKGDAALLKLKPLEDEIVHLRADIKRVAKERDEAITTIRDRGLELARTESIKEIDVSKIAPANLAKIVSINGTGDMPYISIGSADNLKRQVTFSIYGKGVDGKPLKEPKGRLEVIRITGEHMAQARITDLRDARRDPVLVGDFLFNPAWNPNLKQHVAIVGKIDLTGDGHDDMAEFIRNLKNQNVEIDAWMDSKNKLNGEITRQTDLLIVGTSPDYGTGVIKADDVKNVDKDKKTTAMQDIQTQAEKLGVRIVRLNTFLEMSGYPLPKAVGSERGKIEFQRTLPAAGSPIYRKDAPK